MQKAAFSIVKYHFDRVLINLANHQSNEFLIDFKPNGVFKKETSAYELCFRVKVFNENNDANAFVEVDCNGEFKFENVTNFDEIPDFFYRNCIAILFPFVRAYVSIITSQANVPGLILPTLNLTSLETELK